MAHLRKVKRETGQSHSIRGLVDEDTGEIVVDGLSPKTAQRKGLSLPREDAAVARGERPPEPQIDVGDETFVPPARVKKQDRTAHTPTTPTYGLLEGWQIPYPPYVFSLFALARKYIVKDDGTEYDWTPEDLASWMWRCIRAWNEFVLPKVIARAVGGGDEVESRMLKVIKAMEGMSPEEIQAAAAEAFVEQSDVMSVVQNRIGG